MITPTRKILNPCLDSTILKDIVDIPKRVCIKKQAEKSLQGSPIFITDADHDYILEKIMRIEQIDYERPILCKKQSTIIH